MFLKNNTSEKISLTAAVTPGLSGHIDDGNESEDYKENGPRITPIPPNTMSNLSAQISYFLRKIGRTVYSLSLMSRRRVE